MRGVLVRNKNIINTYIAMRETQRMKIVEARSYIAQYLVGRYFAKRKSVAKFRSNRNNTNRLSIQDFALFNKLWRTTVHDTDTIQHRLTNTMKMFQQPVRDPRNVVFISGRNPNIWNQVKISIRAIYSDEHTHQFK